MLWPRSVKSMFHSPSGLPLICVAPFFPFVWGVSWICFYLAIYQAEWSLDTCIANKPTLTRFPPVPLSLSRPACFVHRPSTKTIWFWRKEINTSTHSLPGRPTPTHTSPTSTPTTTINLWRGSSHSMPSWGTPTLSSVSFDCILFFCASYWDFVTPRAGWSHLGTPWQLVC